MNRAFIEYARRHASHLCLRCHSELTKALRVGAAGGRKVLRRVPLIGEDRAADRALRVHAHQQLRVEAELLALRQLLAQLLEREPLPAAVLRVEAVARPVAKCGVDNGNERSYSSGLASRTVRDAACRRGSAATADATTAAAAAAGTDDDDDAAAAAAVTVAPPAAGPEPLALQQRCSVVAAGECTWDCSRLSRWTPVRMLAAPAIIFSRAACIMGAAF